jgi:hypothetical protein
MSPKRFDIPKKDFIFSVFSSFPILFPSPYEGMGRIRNFLQRSIIRKGIQKTRVNEPYVLEEFIEIDILPRPKGFSDLEHLPPHLRPFLDLWNFE